MCTGFSFFLCSLQLVETPCSLKDKPTLLGKHHSSRGIPRVSKEAVPSNLGDFPNSSLEDFPSSSNQGDFPSSNQGGFLSQEFFPNSKFLGVWEIR